MKTDIWREDGQKYSREAAESVSGWVPVAQRHVQQGKAARMSIKEETNPTHGLNHVQHLFRTSTELGKDKHPQILNKTQIFLKAQGQIQQWVIAAQLLNHNSPESWSGAGGGPRQHRAQGSKTGFGFVFFVFLFLMEPSP